MATQRKRPVRQLGGILLASAAIVAAAVPLRAQLITNVVPQERLESEEDQVKKDMDNARFHLGPVRLLPSFSVPNAGYNSNIYGTTENPVSDWTFTLQAGARFLLPMGPKMYFRVNAFPSYTWSVNFPERNNFGGAFDASVLGFFNHAFLNLNGFYNEGYSIYSSQFPALTLVTTHGGTGELEVRIVSRFSLFGGGYLQVVDYAQPGGTLPEQFDVRLNNRTDTAVRGGLRYHFSPQWSVGLMVEETWSDFQLVPETRNNHSTGYLLTLNYNKPKFYLNLTGGYRQGEAIDNSLFPSYETGIGSFFASYYPIHWLEVQGYGHRSVNYAVTDPLQPYYFENRLGGGVNIQFLSRFLLRGFALEGPNQYPIRISGGAPTPDQRVLTYGGGLSIKLIGKAVLTATWTRNDYEQTVGYAGRSYDVFITNLTFSGEFQR